MQVDIQKQNSILVHKNELNAVLVVNPKSPRVAFLSMKLVSAERRVIGLNFKEAFFLLRPINNLFW